MTFLDTDSLSLLMNGHLRITERVEQAEDQVGLTIITRIEILQGRFASILKAADARQLMQAQEWLERNEEYMSSLPIIPIDTASAQKFDELRKRRKLRKIGRADLLIASITLARRATLVTCNLRHFRLVPGLRLENWAD